ncbi:N-acetylated-alpha-linked acidic dipeptidase [Mytilus galloprovincialis]|uniref:glutamate carboxypeptidase II n=1 Tax=Mytilus galloprovincialis TaxID=29158 RepID=A0A8B6F9U5_MYTGA|nr:N-acetylated-alpha-linked acidic dipeptidase [Mytilus galloprovincialis]
MHKKGYSLDEPAKNSSRSIFSSRYAFYVLQIFIVLVATVLGILIGRYALCKTDKSVDANNKVTPAWDNLSPYYLKDGDPAIREELMNSIDANNIRQYLKGLSENPHLAGTPADRKQAKELEKFWKDNGMDEVFITPYDVLLSYPNTTDESIMNQIQILNGSGDIQYASPLYEDILDPSENKSNVVPPFNAYSAPGIVNSSELIYVNYGRVEDYRYLEDNTSVNVSGKIVIARYDKIFRGDKVQQATRHGAIGIIIYSDPADYSNGQTKDVYPHSIWLPPSGTQRGTVKKTDGDPLTPGYPATETAYRLGENDPSMNLPTIPVHPIGYGIARELFDKMTGTANLPASWRGAMNVTYRIGGPLNKKDWKVRMRISTSNKKRTIHNVFGIIRGDIEPDRYVLMGNHRDAWVFGAIDPSSGTAVMKEISRVMGNLVKSKKWRPRRSIIFCSWGGEEYGLIGSNEWVEQFVKNLQTRSVAYVNVDIAVGGNYSLSVAASPLLNSVIYNITKKMPSPDMQNTYSSLYLKWAHDHPDEDDITKPSIDVAGSGSDFAPFVQLAGVPICDISYSTKTGGYPLYHSKYETFNVVDKLMDPGFKLVCTQSKIWVYSSTKMVDSFIVNALDESLEVEEEEVETEPSFMHCCTFCSYSSKYKQNVKRHTQNAHAPNNAETKHFTMYLCDQCGMVFKTASGLNIHYKGKHTQEFRFKCKVCDRGFNTLWNYRGHITTHEPVLRHRCDVCDKTFAYKETLKQHITSVHTNETSIIICSKEGCGASCNSQKSLKEHFLAVHGGRELKCDLCGKSYKWRSSLRYHKEHVHC